MLAEENAGLLDIHTPTEWTPCMLLHEGTYEIGNIFAIVSIIIKIIIVVLSLPHFPEALEE